MVDCGDGVFRDSGYPTAPIGTSTGGSPGCGKSGGISLPVLCLQDEQRSTVCL